MTVDRCIVGDCREVRATVAELAYCAGVIDSDGMIGVKLNTYFVRTRGDSSASYMERVSVKQVEPEAIELLRRLFRGAVYIQDPSAKRGRSLYSWDVTNLMAARCLLALLPYLRIKRAQAENCLALRFVKDESKRQRVAKGRGHQGAAVRSAYLTKRMQEAYEIAKHLNRVGADHHPAYVEMQKPRTAQQGMPI